MPAEISNVHFLREFARERLCFLHIICVVSYKIYFWASVRLNSAGTNQCKNCPQ